MPLSPLNPAQPPGTDPDSRANLRIAALERRIRTLEALFNGGAVQQVPLVAALPAAGRKGRVVMLDSDGKLYRDTGATWIAVG